MSAYLREKKIQKEVKNATIETFILDVANKKQLNLHKPYIDSIFLAPKNARKAKKVLGVHGWNSKSDKSKAPSKWYYLKEYLVNQSIPCDVPQFDINKETSYSLWRNELEKYDIASYDTIIAASFGCPVILQYLKEKNIKVDRLILQAPSGLKGNEYLEKIQHEFTFSLREVRDFCNELIVTCSKDDTSDSAHYGYSKYFVENTGAYFIEVDGLGHVFNGW